MQWRNNGVGRVDKFHGVPECRAPEFQENNLRDLQILGCELNCTKIRLAAGLRPGPLGEL